MVASMEQRTAVVWTCLVGAALSLVLPPAVSFTTSVMAPTRPRLTHCKFFDEANVTCYWEPGDAQSHSYTLKVERITGFKPKRPQDLFGCTTSGYSCSAKLNSSVTFNFCVSVTSHGPTWKASSPRRCQSGQCEEILPQVYLSSVKAVKGMPKCLNITWGGSDFPLSLSEIKAGNLSSQIQFAAQGELDVHTQNVTVRGYSFHVCLSRLDTVYRIRLHHRYVSVHCNASHPDPELYWNPWSKDAWGRTGEDAPSASPALWRKVNQTDKNGWRNVSLLWQPLPHFLANGRILYYNVTCHTEGGSLLSDRGTCRDLNNSSTSCSLRLPARRCSCALTASNSVGTSPKRQIWLLGDSETEPPAPSHLTVCPLSSSRLDVRWRAPVGGSVTGYVVEWSAVKEMESSTLHWKTLDNFSTALVITEGIKALERYAVSVRALFANQGAGKSRTVYNYTQQGVPSVGPAVNVEHISGSTVKLTWTPVPVEQLNGFLRSYTLRYTTANQPVKSVKILAQDKSYSLEIPLPGHYNISISANTDAGAGPPGTNAHAHIVLPEVNIMMWTVLPVILTCLLVLLACLAQTKIVKQKLLQNIPDPSHSSLAHWTSTAALESVRQPVAEGGPKIKYCEVVLPGESELQSTDPEKDFTYKRVCNLQTNSSYCCPQPPLSETQTLTHNLEKTCTPSTNRAQMTPNTDLSFNPSIYANLPSQPLQSSPELSTQLTYLQCNDRDHSSISKVTLQPGGDSNPNISSTKCDSPLSQTDELRVHHLQWQEQSADYERVPASSVLFFEVKSPQKYFSKSQSDSVPLLQAEKLTHLSDSVLFSACPSSLFVDLSYCPLQCDGLVSPAD